MASLWSMEVFKGTWMDAVDLTSGAMLELRMQFEIERIQKDFDRDLLLLLGEAAHDLLSQRHYSRSEITADIKVRNLAFNVDPLTEIPAFIRTEPALVSAWMAGINDRRETDEEQALFAAEDAFWEETDQMASAFRRGVL